MASQNITWRLAPEGGDKVVAEAKRAEQAIVQGQAGVASATDKAVAAADRQIAKLRETAQAAAATTATQRRIEALAGGSTRLSLQDQVSAPGNANARVSARVFEVADQSYERRARELKNILDPLGAAQDKLNDELREYQTLAKAGKLSTEQLAQAQALARTRFDESTVAIQRSERGLTRLAVASRLNLARQGSDVFVTAAMGMSPAMIAIQQGPQIMDALATSGFKANAAMIAAGAGLSVAAAGVVLLSAAWMRGQDEAATYSDLTSGVGRTAGLTAEQLKALTVAAAESGEISRKAAREMAAEYLATGQIGGQVLGDLISLTKDYASFTGTDAEGATKALASAMLDPKKAGHDLTVQFGLLNQEQLTNIDNMIEQGDLLGAQKLLLDELTNSVAGHAGRASEVTDVWNAIGRSISDAIDKLGEFLYLSEDERLPALQKQLANVMEMERRGNPNPGRRRDLESQIWVEETSAGIAAMLDAGQQAEAAANQQAERDRVSAERRQKEAERGARSARAEANRAQREAEREAREQLQRTRRDEDRQAQMDLEVAKGRGDIDGQRALEDAIAVRARERQLIDDGTSAEKARTDALAEQKVLIEARAAATEREVEGIFRANAVEIDRLLGNNRLVAASERHAALVDRIGVYVQKNEGYYAAWLRAASDLKDMDEARAEVAQRTADIREREWRMTLAQASGDRSGLRGLERQDWIDRRAREIEADPRNPLDYGGGDQQASDEYGQLMRAETKGAMRDGLTGLIDDIRSGGLRDALASQFDNAADRLLNKLIDGIVDMDWGAMFSGGGSEGGGNWLSKGFNLLFGRNARGTNYWEGGPTWVGEEGPELIDAPRGARIRDSASSLALMRQSAGGGSGTIVQYITNDFRGAIVSEDVMAQMDAKAKAAADAAVQKAGQEAPLRTIAYMRDRHMLAR